MEIIPVALTDQLKPNNIIRTRTCFILDRRLNEKILKDALDQLIRNHWRKLGARLVSQVNDKRLEYHLPETYDDEYVLFNWSSREDNKSFCDIASFLDVPDVQNSKGRDAQCSLALRSSHLRCLWDRYRHELTTHGGRSIWIIEYPKAWLGVAEENVPPPMVGYSDDALPKSKEYAESPKKEVFRKGRMRV